MMILTKFFLILLVEHTLASTQGTLHNHGLRSNLSLDPLVGFDADDNVHRALPEGDGGAETCAQQNDCLRFSVTPKGCLYEVCLIWSGDAVDGCDKTGTLSHVGYVKDCDRDNTCTKIEPFPMINGEDGGTALSPLCKLVGPGTLVEFLVKDGNNNDVGFCGTRTNPKDATVNRGWNCTSNKVGDGSPTLDCKGGDNVQHTECIWSFMTEGTAGSCPEPCGDTCDEALSLLTVRPDINYEPKAPAENLEVDYSASAPWDIKMYFTYNGDQLNGVDTNFEVIISENREGDCGKDSKGKFGYILFKSDKAIVDESYDEPTPVAFQGIFSADVTSNMGDTEVKLSINTNVDKFFYPIYEEYNDNCNADICFGKLKFCVELQAQICDSKMDSVDVSVAINLDLQVQCDECGPDVVLTRANVIEDVGHTEIGQVECKPCDYEKDGVLPFKQGEAVEACIEMLTEGACVRKIHFLNFVVEKPGQSTIYCVVSNDPALQRYCTFLIGVGSNPNFNPPGHPDDATIKFLPPVEDIQELGPGEQRTAHFSGKVTIGLGCCCDENPDALCNCNINTRRLERGLLSDGVVDMVFAGEDFNFTSVRTEPTGTKCLENFFLSLLQNFLGWLLRLLGKNPFCV